MPYNFGIRIAVLILVNLCVFYPLLFYSFLNISDCDTISSPGGNTVGNPISENAPEDRETVQYQDINILYWKLSRDSEPEWFPPEPWLDNATANYNDVSELIKPIRNLWASEELANSGFEQDDRLLSQLIWILENAENPAIHQLPIKKILLFDSFTSWNFDGNDAFRKDCSGFGSRCKFLDGKYWNNSDILTKIQVDAVISLRDAFHTQNIPVDNDVLRFFVILESIFHANGILRKQNDILVSYWRGSHLVTPYSKWVYYDSKRRRQQQERNYAAGKTKLAAIIMSNCYTGNNRLEFVASLQKHITVDVYGSCGTLNCSRSGCIEQIGSDYKFYLAFENSNCRDYITEKFFQNALGSVMVPIVLGAHPDDYRATAPENSYIHVDDFENPAHLANYLRFLDKHDEEYNKYFEWKGLGEFVDVKTLCRACALTHYADLVPPPQNRPADFRWKNIWKNKLCLAPGKIRWSNGSSAKFS